MRTRTRAVAAAVREARNRRGWSVRALAKNARMSPSTLSRVENPDSEGSLKVETLESLAVALNCPLCELLDEPMNIEYRGIGDWPEALNTVLAERGGYITPTERAFLENRLATLVHDPGRAAAGLPQVQDVQEYWQSQLRMSCESPLWRIIEALIEHGWQLQMTTIKGLGLIVRDMVFPDLTVAQNAEAAADWKKAEKALKKKASPKNKAGRKRKTAKRKKARS